MNFFFAEVATAVALRFSAKAAEAVLFLFWVILVTMDLGADEAPTNALDVALVVYGMDTSTNALDLVGAW